MSDSQIYVIRGTLNWAKIVDEPVMNDFTGEREWSIEIDLDSDGLKQIKSIKPDISKKIKEKNGRKFIQFRQKEFRVDKKTGEKIANKRINIVDGSNNTWPEGVKIGNGSIGDIKFQVKDWGKVSQPGVYIQSVRVLKHEKFERVDFEPLKPGDEFYEEPSAKWDDEQFKKDFDISRDADTDDEIPF